MPNLSNWSKLPRSSSKLISFFRQIVVAEYDGSRFYTHVEKIEGISANYVMNRVNFLSIGNQEAVFNKMVQESNTVMPVIGSVHKFLKEFDSSWYGSQRAFID